MKNLPYSCRYVKIKSLLVNLLPCYFNIVKPNGYAV
jgi:hypothetical protein